MPVNSALYLRICCVAFAFLLAMAYAAEPPHPLMGATREQVMTRMGEPKSQIVAGNRIVLLYARERLILRDGVVVEVESVSSEPVRSSAPGDSTGGTVSISVPSAPASGSRSQPAASAPVPGAPSPTAGSQSKVEIKLVRPPSASYVRPNASTPDNSAPTVVAVPTPPVGNPAPGPVVAVTPNPEAPPIPKVAEPTPPPEPDRRAEEKAKAEKLAAETEAREMKAKAIEATRRRLADVNVKDPESAPVSSNLLMAGAAVIVGGIGFFLWQRRQRQLELAATTVSNTPVGTTATSPPIPRKGAAFTEEYLDQLDPAHFEQLVAAYFNKTGMVAVRAKAGQGAVTQIRISWKGEPKPFAGVLCIAHPTDPVEAKAMVPMVAELGADDIRRGHVVTTGRFTAGAKQFAGEKQLTLLPGDALLEKLNGLPEAVRKEIMSAVATGEPAPTA